MALRHRIMFVDDEIKVLDALRRSFRRHEDRWDMEFVADPAAALDSFRRRPAEVVVTDMKMPGMNGIQMVMAMRQTGADATYIVLTGTADLRTAIDAINRAEIFRFFTKPCPSFLLAEGIQTALSARRPPPAPVPPAPSGPSLPVSGGIGEPVLDTMPVAVLVVDAEARVLFMNRRGGLLCAAGDGLTIGPQKICRAATPADTQRLHRLIASAVTDGEGGVMAAQRGEAGPLSVAVTPLDGDGGAPRAVLYVSDPEDRPVPSPDQLAGLLGLTLAEARVTHALALGQSLDEAAQTAGITVGTARGYLKQVFGKTGKSRQAELVRLVLSLPVVSH